MGRPFGPPLTAERFLTKVRKTESCWLWLGDVAKTGYGTLYVPNPRSTQSAHRVAYTLLCGPVPSGKWVLHHCDVKLCVNPAHLYIGTVKENVRDAASRGLLAAGERHGGHVLSAETVRALRAEFKDSKRLPYGIKKRAAALGVTTDSIKNAIRGKTWANA